MGIKLQNIVYGLLLFSLILATGVLMIGDINENYNAGIGTDDYSPVYDTINDTYDLGQSMKNDTVTNADFTTAEDWEGSVQGAYKSGRTMKDTFSIIGDIINTVAEGIGVPTFMVQFAITALTVTITFGLIYLFMRYSP